MDDEHLHGVDRGFNSFPVVARASAFLRFHLEMEVSLSSRIGCDRSRKKTRERYGDSKEYKDWVNNTSAGLLLPEKQRSESRDDK